MGKQEISSMNSAKIIFSGESDVIDIYIVLDNVLYLEMRRAKFRPIKPTDDNIIRIDDSLWFHIAVRAARWIVIADGLRCAPIKQWKTPALRLDMQLDRMLPILDIVLKVERTGELFHFRDVRADG